MERILIENIKYEKNKFIISFSSPELSNLIINDNVFVRFNIYRGKEISFEEIEEIRFESLKQIGIDRIINSKMNQKTEYEIQNILENLELSNDVIEDVIKYLKRYNYINDRLYAEAFVRDKINLNQYGPIKIRYLLKCKGISDSIIDEALSQYSEEKIIDVLKILYKKKFYNKTPDDIKSKNKITRFFYQKGFSVNMVHDLMKELDKND